MSTRLNKTIRTWSVVILTWSVVTTSPNAIGIIWYAVNLSLNNTIVTWSGVILTWSVVVCGDYKPLCHCYNLICCTISLNNTIMTWSVVIVVGLWLVCGGLWWSVVIVAWSVVGLWWSVVVCGFQADPFPTSPCLVVYCYCDVSTGKAEAPACYDSSMSSILRYKSGL